MGNHVSRRYQDYVICDRRFIGDFEGMYQNSAEIPWHQDETVNAIFSDLTVTILKRRRISSLLDVGCGLGYMADRLQREIPELRRVVGVDVSETAIQAAQKMFPAVQFVVGTPETLQMDETFQVVCSKDVLWYVLSDVTSYLRALARRSSKWLYIGQSFPESRPFYGENIFPKAQALLDFLAGEKLGKLEYSIVEIDANYGGREYAHALIQVM